MFLSTIPRRGWNAVVCFVHCFIMTVRKWNTYFYNVPKIVKHTILKVKFLKQTLLTLRKQIETAWWWTLAQWNTSDSPITRRAPVTLSANEVNGVAPRLWRHFVCLSTLVHFWFWRHYVFYCVHLVHTNDALDRAPTLDLLNSCIEFLVGSQGRNSVELSVSRGWGEAKHDQNHCSRFLDLPPPQIVKCRWTKYAYQIWLKSVYAFEL